ncbi:MAG TPA: TetR/AcrR family transcriptional regulator [Acidimicrobiales bacterium]|nr:TetR/AcrR family transcriptional regulator [Acidimicrobiales bacterium]
MSRDERQAERRRRLLDAGLGQVGTAGYARTTIEGLCAGAGVTPRHFYEEFSGREPLLLAVFEEIVGWTREAVAAAVAAAPVDPERRVRAGIGAFLHALLDDPRRARVACVEVVGVSPTVEGRRREVLHEFAAFITGEARQLQVTERPDTGSFAVAAMALVGGTNELVVEWVLGEHRPPLDDLADEITRLFLAVGRTYFS